MSILQMRGIAKSFPGVKALKGVDMEINPGEIRGLAGENGAGKSTLMKVLSGAYSADEGTVAINGNVLASPSPEQMIAEGVAVIYQELAQAEHLTVAENIMLGRLPRNRFGAVDWNAARARSREVMASLGFNVDPDALISSLSVAKRQMVEISKVISRNAKIVILDEPSAVLGDVELELLFAMIKRVSREQGVAFIYITHRLKEFFDICDSVTVMRDGEVIATQRIDAIDADEIIRLMVGRAVVDLFPPRNRNLGEVALRVDGLSRAGVLAPLSFEVRRGEIFGICGLAGSGRSEILHALIGADAIDGGDIELFGQSFRPRSPGQSLAAGIGLLPEDRKTQGAFLGQSVAFNIAIGARASLKERLHVSPRNVRQLAETYIRRLKVKTSTPHVAIGSLSGGNQQKCLLARQMNAGCDLFLVDEPTRGVDVGAKREIYEVLHDLADRAGAAIVVVSSDLLEVIGLCDRVAVMREGEMTGVLEKAEASEESIMRLATYH